MRVYLDNCCYNRPFDDHFDYTEWRKDHLFVGETVDTLVDKIRAFERDHSELAEATHA